KGLVSASDHGPRALVVGAVGRAPALLQLPALGELMILAAPAPVPGHATGVLRIAEDGADSVHGPPRRLLATPGDATALAGRWRGAPLGQLDTKLLEGPLARGVGVEEPANDVSRRRVGHEAIRDDLRWPAGFLKRPVGGEVAVRRHGQD